MKQRVNLSASMTLAQFDNGYWYATELKAFAKSIGIGFASKLRKDQLEYHIKKFLETGKTVSRKNRVFTRIGTKDVDLGLSLDLPVMNYTNDKRTKVFLEKEAKHSVPGLNMKSGACYRLNRWREEQQDRGVKITYGDVVREFVRLNQVEGPFAKIPQARYINFLSDYLKAEKGATRDQAIRAWERLKLLDVPKNYHSWKKLQLLEK